MKQPTVIRAGSLLVLLPGLLGWAVAAAQQTPPPPQDRGAAVEKRLEDSLDMPLLRGETWRAMNPDQKVAFIWGMGHVVEIEQELMSRFPTLNVDNFSKKIVEGMANVPMNTIVETVDRYYQTYPNEQDTAVVRVIWDQLVRPNLKTGIAGRPLNKTPAQR